MELNEQTLEQILTRQREKYQRHPDELRHDFKLYVEGQTAAIWRFLLMTYDPTLN